MSNPIPGRITPQMWRLWTETQAAIPGAKLGGIYAGKPGYHSSRQENQSKWPGNYSIRLALDKQGPSDKAAAIDLTLSDAEMRRRTRYLADAAKRNDPRLAAVREFYGTLDSRTVYGRIKDSRTGPWRASAADRSHLWHIHISIFRAYTNNWGELAPIVSVLSGQTLKQWQKEEGNMPKRVADELLNRRLDKVDPDSGTSPSMTIANFIRWVHKHVVDIKTMTREQGATLAALSAAVGGGDVAAAVRAELDRHRAALVAELTENLATALSDEITEVPPAQVEAAVERVLARTRLSVERRKDG